MNKKVRTLFKTFQQWIGQLTSWSIGSVEFSAGGSAAFPFAFSAVSTTSFLSTIVALDISTKPL